VNRRWQLAQAAKRLVEMCPDSDGPLHHIVILLAAIILADEAKPQGLMDVLGVK
jgi:hypothetical protein